MSLSFPHERPKNSLAPQYIALPRNVGSKPYRELSSATDATEPATGIGTILREEDIVLGMAAKGKRSALAKIANRLGRRTDMRGSTILAALLRRKRLGPTAIGYGVAIPHGRLDGLAEPAAMLTVLRDPVWFGTADDDPVDLLLTLLWPKEGAAGFLPALASCCRLLRQPELRARLRASATSAEARIWLETHDDVPSATGLPMVRQRQRHPSAGATWVRMASMTCAL